MATEGEFSATPSALMELREEREVVKEGYRFLDEKRLLLAAEIIQQLKHRRELERAMATLRQEAAASLMQAIERHGLEGLQVHPPLPLTGAELTISGQRFLGVPLRTSRLEQAAWTHPRAIDPSPEARSCAARFRSWLSLAAELAGVSGNLERLLEEYRRTARRARALEDVVLPELDDTINQVAASLEEMDQEEAIRVRLHRD